MFSSDYQPPLENKMRANRVIKNMKEALAYFGEKLQAIEQGENGEEVKITWEAEIGKKLIEKAMKGDLKAISILGSFLGWEAPKNQNINVTGDMVIELVKSKNLYESTKQIPGAPPTIKEIE